MADFQYRIYTLTYKTYHVYELNIYDSNCILRYTSEESFVTIKNLLEEYLDV